MAKTSALRLDALLTGQCATAVCPEFSWNSRQCDGCGDLIQELSECRGMLIIERKILAEQWCGDRCETSMGPQGGEKGLWTVSVRQRPERVAGNCENG